jgi:16S rRNA (cytosine1402-N4)-methyltransferase
LYTSFEHKNKVHIPVLKEEVIEFLNLKEGDRVVDATLGLGGHAKEILKRIGKSGHLYAFEQDERNLVVAKENLKEFREQVTYFHYNFASLKTCLSDANASSINAVFFDLGLSSPHVDDASRGFSFKSEGPLDMRFDQRQSLTAREIVNKWSEEKLVEIFSKYGEERMSKTVARDIVSRRKSKPFETTTELAHFIGLIKKRLHEKHDPATQVFQALRIAVNRELHVLVDALTQAVDVVGAGGRIVVISYHSMEDRIVKNVFRDLSKDLEDPNEPFIHKVIRGKQLEILTKKPISPSAKEVSENMRARSAKMRVAERT